MVTQNFEYMFKNCALSLTLTHSAATTRISDDNFMVSERFRKNSKKAHGVPRDWLSAAAAPSTNCRGVRAAYHCPCRRRSSHRGTGRGQRKDESSSFSSPPVFSLRQIRQV